MSKSRIAWTKVGILQMKYGEDDLGFLFMSSEQTDREIDEIINEAVSVGMGC